jgi:hypothetical protein
MTVGHVLKRLKRGPTDVRFSVEGGSSVLCRDHLWWRALYLLSDTQAASVRSGS